jgi:hypothetical protein
MAATEHDEYRERLTRTYAEQLQGMRDGLLAVNRNVLLYIAEGRERGKQIDAMLGRQAECAAELTLIKVWGRAFFLVASVAILLLSAGVVALLMKVF